MLMKKMLQTTLLAVVFSVSFVATTLLLQACGGGGGSGTPATLPDFGRYEFYVASYLTSTLNADVLQTTDKFTTLVGRYRNGEFPTCPRVRESVDAYILDFGRGCYSPDFDDRVAGQVTVALRDERFASDGKLIAASEVSWQTNNLNEPEGSATGSFSLRRRPNGIFDVNYNLDTQTRCAIVASFNGSVRLGGGWFRGQYTLDGLGTYSAPLVGTLNYEVTSANYQPDRCNLPKTGRIRIQAGDKRGTASFRENLSCGTAFVNWGDSLEEFNLKSLSFDTCER
jgi:hypothetical protein